MKDTEEVDDELVDDDDKVAVAAVKVGLSTILN